MNYHDFWYFEEKWRCMGQDLRKEMMNRLNEIPLPKPYDCWGKADTTFAISYENNLYQYGNSCVYAWTTLNCELFYIGAGNENRAVDFSNRNNKFKQKCKSSECRVYILASYVDRKIADDIETLCINLAVSKGWKLQNVRKIKCEIIEELEKRFPEIKQQFDVFNSFLLDSVLSDSSTLPYGKSIAGKKKTSAVYWEIDDEIKSASEWCKIFNISRPLVYNRMKDHNITLYEALTYPRIPSGTVICGSNITAIDYWKSKGLKPGTDNRATIIGRITDKEFA